MLLHRLTICFIAGALFGGFAVAANKRAAVVRPASAYAAMSFGSTEAALVHALANGQHRNLLAVQKMVKASNDTGTVTPRQMLLAAKTGSFSNSFLKGDAPFQDLAGTASELYSPSAGKALGVIIGKTTGGYGLDAAALIMQPSPTTLLGVGAKSLAANLLGKLATSDSPTMICLLTGAGGKPMDPALASAIARALGAGTAAGAELRHQ